ncbi:hypothetical protein CFN78_19600 [Amycolatopsis antarctica]|uniref:Uncharacterized protein n=1 Tax=Amycolatopsis antarctica TaxID=1854586 RepID=A0A263CYY9_9PSEU|nr:hypothetical protein [Amycolatopsis antarctica]OZM71373.1 hypothetical protein CFN78_19600 [Amycolatopsis antarctica]
MWVDESGGTDTTDTTATADEMTVTIEGEEYALETSVDLDDDGVEETGVVETEDGMLAFSDSDGDGEADLVAEFDAQGNVVTMAEYDEASGEWREVEEPGTGGPTSTPDSTDTGSAAPMTADLPEGEVQVGPATVDTDNDGVNDTAVVQDADGNTIGFTDVNGDGEADTAVVIDAQGNSTTLEHTGDGEWTETGSAGTHGVASNGSEADDSAWGSPGSSVEGVAKIDSATGQWISPN